MNCPHCGSPLPDGARFCYSCGQAIGVPAAPAAAPGYPPPPPPPPAATPPAAPAAPTIAPAGVTTLKCPSCGAPVNPSFGDMVITCEYCGASVSLGGQGWKAVQKHSMLSLEVRDPSAALRSVQGSMDQGFFHRHFFEESKIVDQKLTFVPFWVVPASATTTYRYEDVAVAAGGTVASIAAAEVLGSALGGNRRGGFIAMPMGSPVNATRADTISGLYEFPVVAVKGLTAYQPKEYQFNLDGRSFFDKKQVPDGIPLLNGDLSEDAAQHAARSYVTQMQAEQAHKKHSMVSQLQSQVDVSESELVHIPIWHFTLDHKGQRVEVVVDANAGKVIRTVGG